MSHVGLRLCRHRPLNYLQSPCDRSIAQARVNDHAECRRVHNHFVTVAGFSSAHLCLCILSCHCLLSSTKFMLRYGDAVHGHHVTKRSEAARKRSLELCRRAITDLYAMTKFSLALVLIFIPATLNSVSVSATFKAPVPRCPRGQQFQCDATISGQCTANVPSGSDVHAIWPTILEWFNDTSASTWSKQWHFNSLDFSRGLPAECSSGNAVAAGFNGWLHVAAGDEGSFLFFAKNMGAGGSAQMEIGGFHFETSNKGDEQPLANINGL